MEQREQSEEMVAMGKRLRDTRVALGYTQSDFGKFIGIEANSLSSWESGKRIINPLAILRLHKTLKITPDWIYLGDSSGLPFGVVKKIYKHQSNHSEKQTISEDFALVAMVV